MLKGYLVYDHENATKNTWFIEKFIETANQFDLDVELVYTDQVKHKPLPDFAVVRAISPTTNEYFEEKKIKVFNNELTNLIANDKYRTYQLAKILNIPVMETVKEGQHFDYPFVMKSIDGHGGSQVFMVTDDESFEIAKTNLQGKKCIKQAVSDTLGKDLRVYVLGKKILAGALRTSETSFKSNFSLGGKATPFKAPKECKKIVKKLYRELRFDFVGIDFIFNNGKLVLNEIEDPVGCRMLYSFGKIDAVKEYLKRIKKHLKKK